MKKFQGVEFQSYYSLISNCVKHMSHTTSIDFNPIIVLFLTTAEDSNVCSLCYFNPIIVLFLTVRTYVHVRGFLHFNPIIVLFLTSIKSSTHFI